MSCPATRDTVQLPIRSRAGRRGDTNDRFYVIGGKLCVDFVIRYEQLADDLLEVCRRIGLPQLKSGMRSKKYHYSAYYHDGSRDLVTERRENDI